MFAYFPFELSILETRESREKGLRFVLHGDVHTEDTVLETQFYISNN